MQPGELIRKKRDGEPLSADEIDWFVQGYTRGQIADYQASAWLMAIYIRGMTAEETASLTRSMARSGEQLDVRRTISPVVDKHSTGGVGDKVTLAVAPLVAACGVAVGKMSGRGLGHTGGTIDKLESVAGLRTSLRSGEFLDILLKHHIVLAGQSGELAPADGKLYALRDVTATVESIPLIASSIMSKKLAIGASHLLLDVKTGAGAFMKDLASARLLAKTMVDIGRLSGLSTVATITSMEQPLGCAVGNALELAEAIAILRGEGPVDVASLCYHEAAELLVMTGMAPDMSEADTRVRQAVRTGAALAKLVEVIAAQGGNPRQIERPELLPTAPVRVVLPAPRGGYIAAIEAEKIGLASMHLGAGRFQKGDAIDHRTGFVLQARIGDYLAPGDPLIEIHARDEHEAAAVQPAVLACYRWTDSPVKPPPLIYDTLHP
jgi:pyrimidine-nucleoside phosphorylase